MWFTRYDPTQASIDASKALKGSKVKPIHRRPARAGGNDVKLPKVRTTRGTSDPGNAN
jgi:hypothetical protein